MKRKPLIPLLVVAAAAFIWAVGPSVSFSFLLRSPIVLLRELVSFMWPTTTLDSTAHNASIYKLRRPQLLEESSAMGPAGTGGVRVAPRTTTGSTSVLSPASVLNPPTQPIAQDTLLPVVNQSLPPGTVPDLLPTITAPSVPVPSVSVPDVPSVPSVSVPSVPSAPSVSAPSVPSTPSVSVPSAPTPSTPSVGAPSVGGGTPSGGDGAPGGIGGGIKLP